MAYDPNNVFARILRSEIPCDKVFEDGFALAFNDLHPQAPVHVLVIPKGPYVDQQDFAANASDAEIAGFYRAIAKVITMTNVSASGYRLISNSGANGGQEVPHYHVHVLGGRALGPMLSRK
ncbi:MAG: histidine triad nucleotide-binding protein [Alphaproteobacteria bacterium]|nr:histidine triad nucleotide-binding protein [Alphaproteobacteria bacterium]